MAYIGKEPIVGNFQVCDAISVVNGQAAYTMQVSSVNVVPESANHMLVSLNGLLQKPNSSFTVSGSTITFASNLATGDVIDFIMLLGNVLDIGTPSDSTVTDAKANFVSTSSAAGLQIKGDGTTDGTLQLNCSQNSHGIKLKSPAHSTSSSYTLTFPGTDPSADKFLKTDGSGNLSFADAGGGITSASQFRLTADRTNSGTNDDIDANIEEVDTDYSRIGTAMTQSSGIFSFPSTGIWLITFVGNGSQGSPDDGDCYIKFTTNNSTYNARVVNFVNPGDTADKYTIFCQGIFDVTDTTNDKVKFGTGLTNELGGTLFGDTNVSETYFTFIRLGDT